MKNLPAQTLKIGAFQLMKVELCSGIRLQLPSISNESGTITQDWRHQPHKTVTKIRRREGILPQVVCFVKIHDHGQDTVTGPRGVSKHLHMCS